MWCLDSYRYQIACGNTLESVISEGDNPVPQVYLDLWGSRVMFTGNWAWKWGTLTSKPKYNSRPIVHQYREGTLKSALNRVWKDLKHSKDRMLQLPRGLQRTFWITGQGVLMYGETKVIAKASCRKFEGKGVNCAFSHTLITRNQMIYTWTGWSRGKTLWRTEVLPRLLVHVIWV